MARRKATTLRGSSLEWTFDWIDTSQRVILQKKENKMKKLMIVSFALTLLMSVIALAQYGAQQPDTSKSGTSMKAVSITGTISDDGKMFVSDKDGKSWTISNPDAVKGHEGHHVILQAQVDADKSQVHVMSLKMAKGSM
jgi:hypothetical protein